MQGSLLCSSLCVPRSRLLPTFISCLPLTFNKTFITPHNYISHRLRFLQSPNHSYYHHRLLTSSTLTTSPTQLSGSNNTPNDKQPSQSLLSYIKDKASQKAVRKIHQAVVDTEAGESEWSNMNEKVDAAIFRTATRALVRATRIDLASEIYRLRTQARESRPDQIPPDFPLAASMLKATFKHARKRKEKAEICDLILSEMEQDCKTLSEITDNDPQQKQRAFAAIMSMMTTLLNEQHTEKAQTLLGYLWKLSATQAGHDLDVHEYNTLIRLFGKQRLLDAVFSILDLIHKNNVPPNTETFEFLANATVRQIEFVTGAVSVDTLPEPMGVEVAFVGRSNVGKSSLVNMICNRKALAYVSGRPGKTQQFNYFLVNGLDPESRFYMVDLPGVGYAKVPKAIQDSWKTFMWQYLKFRQSLTVIFHLVDGRHGALKDDELLMETIASVQREFAYVVVLTKMDKMSKQKAKRSVLDKTRAALKRNGCPQDTPIILTSATSRLGKEDMWRHLRSGLSLLQPGMKSKNG